MRFHGNEIFPPRPYFPFSSKRQFNMVNHYTFPKIATNAEISAGCTMHPGSWITPEVAFQSTKHHFRTLDAAAALRSGWKRGSFSPGSLQGLEYPIPYWHRDTLAVMHDILTDSDLAEDMVWAPKKVYDGDGNRVYTELWTGDWWWSIQSMLHPRQITPSQGSCTVIPIILSSDKVLHGAQSGNSTSWPLYLTLGNIPSNKRWLLTKPHARLVALLPDPKGLLCTENIL